MDARAPQRAFGALARLFLFRAGLSRLAQLFNPDLFLASHHDELISSIDGTNPLILPDMATEPLYTAVREVMPETQTLAPIYRTPLVINTRNGKFTIGNLSSRR